MWPDVGYQQQPVGILASCFQPDPNSTALKKNLFKPQKVAFSFFKIAFSFISARWYGIQYHPSSTLYPTIWYFIYHLFQIGELWIYGLIWHVLRPWLALFRIEDSPTRAHYKVQRTFSIRGRSSWCSRKTIDFWRNWISHLKRNHLLSNWRGKTNESGKDIGAHVIRLIPKLRDYNMEGKIITTPNNGVDCLQIKTGRNAIQQVNNAYVSGNFSKSGLEWRPIWHLCIRPKSEMSQ